jgi:UDP-sulfoquinovose synthase
MMRILILGGDGYLGWPMAMNLSTLDYEVYVVDNYLRRRLQRETRMPPLLEGAC